MDRNEENFEHHKNKSKKKNKNLIGLRDIQYLKRQKGIARHNICLRKKKC